MSEIILCKLTDENMKTHGGFQWELGIPAPRLPEGGDLCSESYYHCYEHPLLALLLNPIHGWYKNPRIFKVSVDETDTPLLDHQLKRGYKTMKLTEEIELHKVSDTQRVAFAILCALEVCKEKEFIDWAQGWLFDIDRSSESVSKILRMVTASWASAWASTWVVAGAAARAAEAKSADVAAWAAEAAKWAAEAEKIDLIEIAKKALTY